LRGRAKQELRSGEPFDDAHEHADGKKEGTPSGDPAGMIRSETAGGKYAVDMRMKL